MLYILLFVVHLFVIGCGTGTRQLCVPPVRAKISDCTVVKR